jgi:hypothetical protein
MDNTISFTPAELVAFIGAISAVCAGIATIVGFICKVVAKWKAPEVEQNRRIKELEDDVKALKAQNEIFSQYFVNDNNRFNAVEISNRAILSTLRALLKHAINGNDIEQLKKADEDLDDFLINNYKPRTEEQNV